MPRPDIGPPQACWAEAGGDTVKTSCPARTDDGHELVLWLRQLVDLLTQQSRRLDRIVGFLGDDGLQPTGVVGAL